MHPKFKASEELRFDSSFESGNLDAVYKVMPWEYDLYMRVDTNTRGHLQWFYFSVSYDSCQGHFKDRQLTFNINNFTKSTSLYSVGMRICVAKQSQNYKWHRAGENITYVKSKPIKRGDEMIHLPYQCL